MVTLGNYAHFGQTSSALDLRRARLAVTLCGAFGGIADGKITEEKPLERHHAANTKSAPMRTDR